MSTIIKNSKIIFFGTPQIAAYTLKKLAAKFTVVAAITETDAKAGRGLKLTPPPVKIAAQVLKIPIEQPRSSSEITQVISRYPADLGVIIAYGRILPAAAIQALPRGILNIHGSLLPKYRGAAPIQQAILNGDQQTGVTIMQISPELDTGPLLAQQIVTITLTDTTATLAQKLTEIGTTLLLKTIPLYLNNQLKPLPQSGKASYAPKITKDMGEINWSQSATTIERKIRAFNPWPHAYTNWRRRRLIIHRAKVVKKQLIPQEVQLEGGRKISWGEFINGQRLSQQPALLELTKPKNG